MTRTPVGRSSPSWLILALLLVCAPWPVVASGRLPSSLQLGRLPSMDCPQACEIAVPLGQPLDRCQLESASDGMELQSGHDGEGWLVLRPGRVGGVSGLLTLFDEEGRPHRSLVAGEIVGPKAEAVPRLQLSAADGTAPLVRYLRRTDRIRFESARLDGGLARLSAPDPAGWQRLELRLAPGRAEGGGSVRVGLAGLSLELQASLQESITVLAAASLPASWEHADLRVLREELRAGDLRARVALLGGRRTEPRLRLFEARVANGEGSLELRGLYDLRASESPYGRRLLRLRLPGAASRSVPRQAGLLRLAGERATLIDPVRGPLRSRRSPGLRFAGVASARRLNGAGAYSLRRNLESGELRLRRWVVRGGPGDYTLEGRTAQKSLNELLGSPTVGAFGLRSFVHREQWPERPIRENLLLLGTRESMGKVEAPVRIFELDLSVDSPLDLRSARRLYTSAVRLPVGVEPPRWSVRSTPVIDRAGYPLTGILRYGHILKSEIVQLRGLGDRFAGLYYVEGADHSLQCDGYALESTVMLRLRSDGEQTVMERRALREQPLLRATGSIVGVRPLELRSALRGRHAYALTRSFSDGQLRLRLLDAGLPKGTDLPPLVRAGADVRVQASSTEGVELRLRSTALDSEGDPLEIRWSAPGVRFDDPTALRPVGRFPVGSTQVRVRALETPPDATPYQSWALRTVRVDPPTALSTPQWRTSLRGIFPNPANPRVRIAYTVGRGGPVRITLHDAAGRRVRTLREGHQGAGAYDVVWEGRDDAGHAVASGVYYVRLDGGAAVDTGRVVLVR